jgi:DNA-binding NtrC family response regulator
MASILVVEDEAFYRDILARSLTRQGHEVHQAANAGDALRESCRHRPSVVIADWMMRNHLHGLQISQALGILDPGIQTILITGYPSPDLRLEAQQLGVDWVLEKPFELAEIHDAVASVGGRPRARRRGQPVGVLEIDPQRVVRFANPVALDLLGEAESEGKALRDLLSPSDASTLEASAEAWVEVAVERRPETRCVMRSRTWRDDSGWLVAICDVRDELDRDDQSIALLLGELAGRETRWPGSGRVLLVDDESQLRKVSSALLRRRGCSCFTAESHALALRLVEADPGIEFVVIDFDMPGEDLFATVSRMLQLRPELLLIGTSGSARADDFRRVGVDRFMPKPWSFDDLLDLIRSPPLR